MTAEQPTLLTIHTSHREGEVTLRLTGEIDMSSAEQLRDALLSAARHLGSTLRIDMAGVTFMDSTGLAVLIFTQRRVSEEGGRLILDRPSSQVLRVLQVSGTDRLLEIEVALPVAKALNVRLKGQALPSPRSSASRAL